MCNLQRAIVLPIRQPPLDLRGLPSTRLLPRRQPTQSGDYYPSQPCSLGLPGNGVLVPSFLISRTIYLSGYTFTAKEPTLQQDTVSRFRGRVALPQLHIDHNSNLSSLERISLVEANSTVSSPSASVSMSPRTPSDTPASAVDGPPESPKVEEEPHDLQSEILQPQPSTAHGSSAKPGKAGSSREKRKRSRVTPEQLTHLERFFAADRSPTAARRKEISELLGMQERQTQIWFQNRCVRSFLSPTTQEA